MTVGVRQAGLGILEIADLLGFFTHNGTSRRLVDERGRRRMVRLVGADRNGKWDNRSLQLWWAEELLGMDTTSNLEVDEFKQQKTSSGSTAVNQRTESDTTRTHGKTTTGHTGWCGRVWIWHQRHESTNNVSWHNLGPFTPNHSDVALIAWLQ